MTKQESTVRQLYEADELPVEATINIRDRGDVAIVDVQPYEALNNAFTLTLEDGTTIAAEGVKEITVTK